MHFVKSVTGYQTENGHGKNGISKIGIYRAD